MQSCYGRRLGPAGIVVTGNYRTLTTIGHHSTGQLAGITATQCGRPGSQVAAEEMAPL